MGVNVMFTELKLLRKQVNLAGGETSSGCLQGVFTRVEEN
jgi:hypothetical protein